MLFPSEIFLFVFLPVVLLLYYGVFIHFPKVKNIFLLAASLFFYAWGEPKHVYLMIAVILVDWLSGMMLSYFQDEKKKARIVLIISIILNLAVLGYFKYFTFIERNIKSLFNLDFEIKAIALPIGISFFIFQGMSYVIDVYRGEGEVQANPLNVGLYISLFPQLIAGPIVRYQTVAEQIKSRKENMTDFTKGVCRFVIGLSKKVILANNVGMVADEAFKLINGGSYQASVLMAWLGAISYSLQILLDFSGYSDMAIGLGQMFGFRFEENFNYPYISGSVTEFWRRWHISLSSWFRDYVYIPLGGSRVKTTGRLVFNLFVVWLLTGIWHGAEWTFIIWGLLYFVALTVEKLLGIPKKKKPGVIGHVITLIIVVFGWVIFRAENLSDLGVYLGAMFGRADAGFADAGAFAFIKQTAVYYIAAIICCMPILSGLDKKFRDRKWWNVLYIVFLAGILGVSITFIFKQSYNPFIYFNF